MAEVVKSVVVQESVSQIVSGIFQKYEEKQDSNVNRNLERLEMAQIRLEAALETSRKWQITDASMLRWSRKLKYAAQECGDTLQNYKHRILQNEQMEQEARNYSLPNWIVHATKSFVFSTFNTSKELDRSIVQRFEWFADGATDFLRFMELGGTPRRHLAFNSLVKHLFAGKGLYYKIVRRKEYPSFLLWLVPSYTAESGIEVTMIFIHKDSNAPEGNFFFNVVLQLSESTDIIGIAIKCSQLFAPDFKCVVENVRNKLVQLTTQDLSFVPSVCSYPKGHWNNLNILASQWFRPNPLCCKQHVGSKVQHFSNQDITGLSDVSLEPVIAVNLQCQVSLSVNNNQKGLLPEDNMFLQDSQHLKAGIIFAPHGSSEDMLSMHKRSSIVEMVGNGKGQNCLHTDITLEQLQGIMLPRAIDYFCQNSEATVCQMIWKSKHGSALIQVEKAILSRPRTHMRTRRTFRGARKGKLFEGQDHELWSLTHVISHLHDIWGAHMPIQLQSSFKDWIQKQQESQSQL